MYVYMCVRTYVTYSGYDALETSLEGGTYVCGGH
jgi:hypothetical protein